MVQCPVCLESIWGGRFAPHLEKCLKRKGHGKGKNGKINGKAPSNRFDFPAIPMKERKVRDTSDPYPESTIIRIKLREGGKAVNQIHVSYSGFTIFYISVVPYGNSFRIGATLEDFNANSIDRSDGNIQKVESKNGTSLKVKPKPPVHIAKNEDDDSPYKRPYKKRLRIETT